jgi:uncharacterized protein (TIGR03905 family)
MIKVYRHICKGTCSKEMTLTYDTETNKLIDFSVVGGCNGNLKGIRALIVGEDLDKIASKLYGVTCGPRPTSCPDQIAKAIKEIKSGLNC